MNISNESSNEHSDNLIQHIILLRNNKQAKLKFNYC